MTELTIISPLIFLFLIIHKIWIGDVRWDLYVIFNTLTKKKFCHCIIFSMIQVNEIYSILKLYQDVPYQLSNVKEAIATYEVMICLFV